MSNFSISSVATAGIVFLAGAFSVIPVMPSQAQNVTVPAVNTTGTIVTPNGSGVDITGGKVNDINLFHDFAKFGLDINQFANFSLSNATIQNILGRVSGGNPSIIDGLIKITGSTANLYLMNPSGFVFGTNASLNVGGSFTATTATGIGFSGGNFNAVGVNDFAALVGNPNGFVFSVTSPSAIVNAGNLTVSSGNINLIAGTVANTGTLSANGNISIASVPGSKLVKISQPNGLISLEVDANALANGITTTTLPDLINGSGLTTTGLTTSPTNAVTVTSLGKVVNTGDVVATKVTSRNATLSSVNNLTLPESQLVTTGDLNLLAKDTVWARDSVANRFLAQSGGNLSIQGNQSIDILALNHPQTPFVSGGNLGLASNGNISGDAHFYSGGQFTIRNLSGVVIRTP